MSFRSVLVQMCLYSLLVHFEPDRTCIPHWEKAEQPAHVAASWVDLMVEVNQLFGPWPVVHNQQVVEPLSSLEAGATCPVEARIEADISDQSARLL